MECSGISEISPSLPFPVRRGCSHSCPETPSPPATSSFQPCWSNPASYLFFFFNINSTFFWDAHREKSSFVLLEIEDIYSDPRESTPGGGSWWSRAFARVGEERLRWRTWPWRRRTGRRKQTGKNRTPIPSRSLLGYFRNNGQQRELSRQRGIANSKVQVLVLQRDGFRTWEKVSSQSSSVVRSWGFTKVPGQRPWRKRSQRERGRGCQGTWM